MFKVICINDAERPNEIPASKWIKKGEIYTVLEVAKMRVQGGILGFKLYERNIDDCFPYQYFTATRFAVPTQDQLWADEYLATLLKEAKEEFVEEPVTA